LTLTAMGVPSPSQIKCSFVLKPPWLRPKAWSAGSPMARFFFRSPSRRLVSSNHGTVYGKQFPVNFIAVHFAGLQSPQNAFPHSLSAPFAKAIVHGLPGTEALRDVSPTAAIGQGPQDRIYHEPVVFPLTASLSVGREHVLDLSPLFVRELVGRRNHRHVAL